jgi:PAS domain S-box-containing protein
MGTMTLSGRLVRANRSMSALFGVPVQDLVGVSLADLTGDDDDVERALARVAAGEAAVQVEHRGQTSENRHFRSTLSPVLDARGRPLYLFLQVLDVTRQVMAEAELRRTEARFRLLVETVQDYAIFMLDPDGRIASWNSGAERSKGYAADEIIGRHFRVFYPPEVAATGHCERELELALRDGKYEEEGWRVRKDGSRFWATVTITAVHDDDGELIGFAKVTRDNTERREMLEQLARAAEAQAEFFAITAHELRSPITVLTGSAQTLARHHDQLTGDERAELSDGMGRSAEQLRRLLADLLTASRLQAHKLDLDITSLDLAEHVQQAVGVLRHSVGESEVTVAIEPGLRVAADPVRLTQVVDNLVLNAVRHGRSPVRLAAAVHGDLVELSVHDAGAGVDEELQPRLFERFATGSNRGTGLGLFLVRELARAHGGDATYRVDDGAFVVTLPRGEPA